MGWGLAPVHRGLPTGKPDAGDPPVRFGREGERFALLLSSSAGPPSVSFGAAGRDIPKSEVETLKMEWAERDKPKAAQAGEKENGGADKSPEGPDVEE